jgi:hypothetical protein
MRQGLRGALLHVRPGRYRRVLLSRVFQEDALRPGKAWRGLQDRRFHGLGNALFFCPATGCGRGHSSPQPVVSDQIHTPALFGSAGKSTVDACLGIIERASERFAATGVAHIGGGQRHCHTEGHTSRRRLPVDIDGRIRPLLERGLSHNEVAEKLGIGVSSVSARARGMGIRRR